MWDYATRVSPRTYRLADSECTCNLADLVYIGPRTDDPHPGEVQLSDYWDPEAPYLAKSWFTRYLWDLRDAIEKDDKPMRQALLDSEAMGRAVKAANRCNVCGKDAAKGLTELLGKLEAMVDACISNVSTNDADSCPFDKANPHYRCLSMALLVKRDKLNTGPWTVTILSHTSAAVAHRTRSKGFINGIVHSKTELICCEL